MTTRHSTIQRMSRASSFLLELHFFISHTPIRQSRTPRVPEATQTREPNKMSQKTKYTATSQNRRVHIPPNTIVHLLLHHASRTSPDVRAPVTPPSPSSRRVRYHPEQLRGLVGDGTVPFSHVLAIRVVTEHLGKGGAKKKSADSRKSSEQRGVCVRGVGVRAHDVWRGSSRVDRINIPPNRRKPIKRTGGGTWYMKAKIDVPGVYDPDAYSRGWSARTLCYLAKRG